MDEDFYICSDCEDADLCMSLDECLCDEDDLWLYELGEPE